MTCRRSPCTFSSRVIGRSSQSGPLQGVVTLGTIGQMALTLSGHKCQHYSDSVHPRAAGDAAGSELARVAPVVEELLVGGGRRSGRDGRQERRRAGTLSDVVGEKVRRAV